MLHIKGLARLGVGPIDLQLDRGGCVAISGRSGSGKSVLLRMIADLDPHTGSCALDGQSCADMPAPRWRRQVVYVAAESGWWAPQVDMHFAPDTDLAALLPSLALPAEAGRWPVSRLSTGERQRLALLRALSPQTRVLLLDEPTSGLDAQSTEAVESLLRARLAQGLAVLIVTHDPDQARRLASRHFRLADGRLEETAP